MTQRVLTLPLVFALVVGTIWSALPASSAGPTDLILYRDTSLQNLFPGSEKHSANEPSMAMSPSGAVLYVGSMFGAISNDAGQTFTRIEVVSDIPNTPGVADQEVIYLPAYDLFIWSRQFNRGQGVRITAVPASKLFQRSEWRYWDIFNYTIGQGNYVFDEVKISTTTNFFYFASHLNGGSGLSRFVIVRIPLTEIVNAPTGSALTISTFVETNPTRATYAVGNALCAVTCTVAHFGLPINGNTLQIWRWPDTDNSPTTKTISITPFPFKFLRNGWDSQYSCPSPDGQDICAGPNTTVSGWYTTDSIGFAWRAGSGSGGFGTFPYPYIHAIRLNHDLTLRDEPIISSPNHGLGFVGVAANASGHIGASLVFAGGGYYPSSAVFVLDDISPTSWTRLDAVIGTGSPGASPDYVTTRPSPDGKSWVATTFVISAVNQCGGSWCIYVDPHFLWFGRQQNNPLPPTVTPTPSVTRTFMPTVPNEPTATPTAIPTATVPSPTPSSHRGFIPLLQRINSS